MISWDDGKFIIAFAIAGFDAGVMLGVTSLLSSGGEIAPSPGKERMSFSPATATFVSGAIASRRCRVVIPGIDLSPGKFLLSGVLSVLFFSDAVCILFDIGLSRLRRTSGLWIMAVVVLISGPSSSESRCRHFVDFRAGDWSRFMWV